MAPPRTSGWPRRTPGPLSGAFGDPPTPDPARADRFALAEAARYEAGGVIGVGGMGEVRAVFDRRLGRMVARKVPRDADAAVRLAAEAELTARLVHPGIVTVLDAGHDEHGRPCYTMPILHGRSLADVSAGASTAARLRLVRHVLEAARAVGFAHSQGVLHRDIKPDHVFVGLFGETQVVDWGLAGPIGEAAAGLGTAGFMPPEQRRGDPLGPPADVWSLGATLYDLLTGEVPGDPPSPVRVVQPTLPPDLAAIVDQALHPDPARRYPDGIALARDLEDWFEGRRVAAHRYSAGELLGRVWAAWRLPIVAVASALSIAAAAVGVASLRAIDQRDRAVEAEAIAAHNLTEAALARALDAMARDDRAAAEVLASAVLSRGPSPDAIGVLARFDGEARPSLLQRYPMQGCLKASLSPTTDKVACHRQSGALDVLTPDDPSSPVRTLPGPAAWAAFTADDHYLFVHTPPDQMRVLDLATQAPPRMFTTFGEATPRMGRHLTRIASVARGTDFVVDGVEGSLTRGPGCLGHGVTQTIDLLADGRTVVACQDGLVQYTDHLGETRPIGHLDPAFGPPSRSDASDDRVVLFQPGGQLTLLDISSAAVHSSWSTEGRDITRLNLADDRVVALIDGGTVIVWDADHGAIVARLPHEWMDARWREPGGVVRIAGAAVEDWTMPHRAPWVHLHPSTAGVAALAFSPDGTRVASAHGDGVIRLSDPTRPGFVAEVPLHWSVAKDVSFSPDGSRLAAITAQSNAVTILDAHTGAVLDQWTGAGSRNLAWLSTGILTTPYAGGLLWWPNGRFHEPGVPISSLPRAVDVQVWPDRAGITLTEGSGGVWDARTTGDTLMLRSVAFSLETPTVASDGNQRLLLRNGQLVYQPKPAAGQADERAAPLDHTEPASIVANPAFTLAAVGYEDGVVRVWSLPDLQVVAVLRGHTSRVVALAFSRDGALLATGSWDGDVRLWSTRPLHVPPATLADEANRAWGADWQELLATLPRR